MDDSQKPSGEQSKWYEGLSEEVVNETTIPTLDRFDSVESATRALLDTRKALRSRIPVPDPLAAPEAIAEIKGKIKDVPGVVVMPDEMTAETAQKFLESATMQEVLSLANTARKKEAEEKAANLAADESARREAVNKAFKAEHGPAYARMMEQARQFAEANGFDVESNPAAYTLDNLNTWARHAALFQEDSAGQLFAGAVPANQVSAMDLRDEMHKLDLIANNPERSQEDHLAASERIVEIRRMLMKHDSPRATGASVGGADEGELESDRGLIGAKVVSVGE